MYISYNKATASQADSFKVTGNWDAQSVALKVMFSQLTDADLKFEWGKEDDLLNRVARRLNKKRDEVIHIIRSGQSAKL